MGISTYWLFVKPVEYLIGTPILSALVQIDSRLILLREHQAFFLGHTAKKHLKTGKKDRKHVRTVSCSKYTVFLQAWMVF